MKLFKKINNETVKNTKINLENIKSLNNNEVVSCFEDFKRCFEHELTIQDNTIKTFHVYTSGKLL